MNNHKEFVINTPTGKRILMEVDGGQFAVLRPAFAPDDRSDPSTRLYPVFGSNPIAVRSDGTHINTSQLWTAIALLINEGKTKNVADIENELFFVPVSLAARFEALKNSGQMIEKWLTYNPITGVIYRKTACEVTVSAFPT